MSRGCVYSWVVDAGDSAGGRIERTVVPLTGLTADPQGKPRLAGRLVAVSNGGSIHVPDAKTGQPRAVPIGNAAPDDSGNFLFEPGRGGGRMDKTVLADPDFRWRYVQASHFGEVNTYFHLQRMASYIEDLLEELRAPRLPQVLAVINAHHAATEIAGIRDGVRGTRQWLPFQGGHYRLPSRKYDLPESEALSPDGEIHLGPGWQLLTDGALVRAAGWRYRANASHNAGIIYHEYGHHVSRHTADFRGNALKPPQRQNNRKAALDEGTSDYWTAVMLGTPHIWAWHRRHDENEVHARSLVSAKTMADFDASTSADPHSNGTIWAAALWDLRGELRRGAETAARTCDLLVLKALLLIGERSGESLRELRRARADFSAAATALLHADRLLTSGLHQSAIRACFERRKIPVPREPNLASTRGGLLRHTAALLKRVPPDEIPGDTELCLAPTLEAELAGRDEPPFSVLAVGDIMLGDRTRRALRERGPDYPFSAVLPLLRRSGIVFGNLEGPFAREATQTDRNFSYRVDPRLATALRRANIGVVTLANNHLTDCGPGGVLETLAALKSAGVHSVGAGGDRLGAHRPAILASGPWRIGLLGYYWNRRTAATDQRPGSAMDQNEDLRADIAALRGQVDRIVVAFHWGVPYQREPLAADRDKARFAVDCGADAVIGHHPHVIQPFEVYRGCPIFYSVGNFAFGSGNSLAEGLMVGFRFTDRETQVDVYPLYVKNRDNRVRYQPKLLRGGAARRILERLAEMSGKHGSLLGIELLRATVRLTRHEREQRCA